MLRQTAFPILRAARRVALLAAFVVSMLPRAVVASELGDQAPAPDTASTDASARRPRELLGFTTDAAVASGFWGEFGETYRQSRDNFVTTLRGAYGWRAWEFGGDVSVSDSGSFSDIDLSAKYVGWKLGPANIGAGAVMGIPTSSGGDFDFAPFATGSLPVGGWDLRSSFGYVITENFFYNAAALRPIGEQFDIRAELDGGFNDNFDAHFVQLLPGTDVHFAFGAWQILLRVSAGAELHPSVNAIASLGLVLTQN